MDKAYDHNSSEDTIYESWERSGEMTANAQSKKPPFVIPLPPPNVTGQLHLGHAAMLAIEDIMIRYKRMTGHEVLWIPGTDHAAIATENVVLKHLGMQNREEMSREEFLEECKKFAQEKHDRIVHQVKKMGAWLDWGREAYTFDEARHEAVNAMFKKLYEDELIVRGHRMINWSVGAQSVLSDDEVEYREVEGSLYHYKYFLADNSGEYLEVATTRPETIFGDTAVALHPKDKRAKKLIGKKVLVPFTERKVPIITDEHVDPKFGTATLKVTPAHDPNDFEIGERHSLPKIQVIDFDGTMRACEQVPQKFHGVTREHCRAELVKSSKYFVKKKSHTHNIGFCYRSETVVEPMLSPQWFVSVEKEFLDPKTNKKTTLKKLTQEAVREKHVKIIPQRFEKTYFQWIDNLRDWCISRQIWWGHRIPVWYDKAGNIHLPREQKFIFARHGQTENGAKEICQFPDDSLNEEGRKQAQELADFLKKKKNVTKIISSPLPRAKEMAEIVAKKLNLSVEILEELQEFDAGDLCGKPRIPETPTTERALQENTGESFQSLLKRAETCWQELQKRESDGAILVVGHRTIFAAMEASKKDKTKERFLAERRKIHDMNFGIWKEISLLQTPKDKNLRQDKDTLDTWFSSALWPFSTLGWPEKTADGEKFYPNDVLETGWDILFFWVARMVMFGRYATGEYPFHTVYLHGLVCDEKGQKMSKSKGNGIDPIEVIDEYGADAVRLSLVVGTSPGNPIPLGKGKISGYRNFVNKLWNAGRFVKMQMEASGTIEINGKPQIMNLDNYNHYNASPADQWIIAKFGKVVEAVNKKLQSYDISSAGDLIYHFIWDDFCNWYIEATKKFESNTDTLISIFRDILKLSHPLCPFVTETLWKELSRHNELLIEQIFPKREDYQLEAEYEENALASFEVVQKIVTKIRTIKSTAKKQTSIPIHINWGEGNLIKKHHEKQYEELIKKFGEVKLDLNLARANTDTTMITFDDGITVTIGLSVIKIHEKEKSELKNQIQTLRARLQNKGYTEKAPKKLVDQTKKELLEAEEKLKKLKS
ncbi:class I tRNA ligase family protein [Candidatus Gracilibacteria bacterium]|nr:class I tRNA ligase family protein [Candidatus Gracilibacteria bacterium]MCF7819155.1 class I tRNA ligase family protein [Candidatus Gracilibacteria bacterium]